MVARRLGTTGLHKVLALVGLLTLGTPGLPAQEKPPDNPKAPAPAAAPAEKPGVPADTIIPLGPNLFPLYSHNLRTADDTETKTVLSLYFGTDRRNSTDKSRFLLPFYFWERQADPPRNRLYLFPFFFQGTGAPGESFTHVPPLFYSSRSLEGTTRILFPFWWNSKDPAETVSTHRILFPLSKFTIDRSKPDLPEKRFRLGLPWILELFEAKFDALSSRLTAFNFLNWKSETESGLSLFGDEQSKGPNGEPVSRTWLFPVYWNFDTMDSKGFFLFPLYGQYASGGIARRHYTPLIWKSEGDGGYSSLGIFPFWIRATRNAPELSYFASFPFFDSWRTARERDWGLFLLLYRNTRTFESGKTAHSILWPLGSFDVEPDGSAGHRRFLPLFIDHFNDRWRFREYFFTYWNYQIRSGTTVDWDFTYILPTYFGWGERRDYFATGFPLYWSGRTGTKGWDLAIPLFYRDFDATSEAIYSLPFTMVSYPSQTASALLAGAGVVRNFRDLKGRSDGWEVNLLWWLFGLEKRPTRDQIRVLPLFWTRRDGDDRMVMVFPFWLKQWGPGQHQDFFFPAYGRFLSADQKLRRDFYAAGTFTRTTEKDDGGEVFRRRDDILWSLLSFQEDQKARLSHQHFLPLGMWRTQSPNVDRTMFLPFVYSHRIQSGEESHRLNLFLGNLFLSKTVETITDTRSPGKVISTDRGVLWPLSRFATDSQGNSVQWVLPLYYHGRTSTEENRSLFPLAYTNRQTGTYKVGYFRYFYLFDMERFEGGHRFTAGQVLFDWLHDGSRQEERLRLFYPIFEAKWNPEGYHYQFTAFLQGEDFERGGERKTNHFLFPVFWLGSTRLQNPDHSYTETSSHFYLFPLYGVSRKSLRIERDFLIPIFYHQQSLDGFAFHVRPFFYLRKDAGETSARLWPLHSNEVGEGAGDWWASRFLYLSKLAVRRQSFSYRLDPYLFWLSKSPQETRVGGLLGLASYRRTMAEGATETSWHVLPLAAGYSRPEESGTGLFPLYYARDFGRKPLDPTTPWRFPFIVNRLRGDGGRLWSFLWKVLEYSDNPDRPAFHDLRIFQEFLVHRRTETSFQFSLPLLFNYLRDDGLRLKEWTGPLGIFHSKEVEGSTRRTLFWIFSWSR